MIVLDTTVLVYAKGTDHPLRVPCRQLIQAVAERQIAATTTIEVIQEFVHMRARRRGREDAAASRAQLVRAV
jgi:predicted nucleic acid-binding protein